MKPPVRAAIRSRLLWTLGAFALFVVPSGFALGSPPLLPSSASLWTRLGALAALSALAGAAAQIVFSPRSRSAVDAQTLSGFLALLALLSLAAGACAWALSGAEGRHADWFGLLQLPSIAPRDRALASDLSEALSHLGFLVSLVSAGAALHAVKAAAASKSLRARRRTRVFLSRVGARSSRRERRENV